jgi:hypothetical protein
MASPGDYKLPATIVALNARPKADGSVRIIANQSCSPEGSVGSLLTDDGKFADRGGIG